MSVAALWTAALSLRPAAGTGTDVYELKEMYSPQGFFSKWNFWTDADPSGGAVQYSSHEAALAAGMVKEEVDHAYFGAQMDGKMEPGAGRPSVRIQSKAAYNSGLFVVKINHAPTGCGTWPAFWLYGEDPEHPWPAWGEYDVAESMHGKKRAMTTLHTRGRCSQERVEAGRDFLSEWEKGTSSAGADNCDVKAPGQFENQGCSQKSPENSWGEPFNQGGGGTYAAEWDPDAGHIRTWFWPVGQEPADLVSRLPMPDTWGTPYSYFSIMPDTCDAEHFKNMRLVFTLNLCGDLGDPYFAEYCPVAARTMNCRALVEGHPEALAEAYWSIGGLDVYQKPRGNLLPFIFFNDAGGHDNGPRSTMQSGFLTVLGAAAAVMGLAGVALVVRAEMSRVHMRDDEESRRSMVVVQDPHVPVRDNGLLGQAGQFIQLMFDGSRRPPALPVVTDAFSRQASTFSRQDSPGGGGGGRLRGFSWASSVTEGATSGAAPHRDRIASWDSVATSAALAEGDAQLYHPPTGPSWML